MDDLHHRLRDPLLAFLKDHYSEEELRSLCYVRFPPVDADFTLGMPKSRMDRDLVAWCERQGQLPHLLAALREQRPAAFQQKLEPLLEREPPPAPRRRAARRDPRQIFISHAMKQDGDFAQRLARDLERRGWSTWLAPNSIQPGEDWVGAISRGLDTSGVFVLVVTEHAIHSEWVERETNAAIMLESDRRIQFFLLRVRPYELPETPALWQVRQQIRFDGDYKAGLQALLTQLDPPGMAALAQQYAQLEAAVRLQNWPRALELGDAIAAAYPDYRDTDMLRAQARAAQAREAQRAQRLAQLYAQLEAASQAEEWDTVLELGAQLDAIQPHYRDVDGLLAAARLAALYTQMQTARAAQEWPRVQQLGHEIQAQDPRYRDVVELLNAAAQQLKPPPKSPQTTPVLDLRAILRRLPQQAWWAGALALVIVAALGLRAVLGGGDGNPDSGDGGAAATQTALAIALLAAPTAAPTSTPTPRPTNTPRPTRTATTTPDPNLPPPNPALGSTWVRPIDGMTLVYVPGGTFPMGSSDADIDLAFDLCEQERGAGECQRNWFGNESPQHDVTLDGFWLDRTEVTNAQFSMFVDKTDYVTTAEEAGGGYTYGSEGWDYTEDADWRHPQGPNSNLRGLDQHPVVLVSWQGANAYCAWAGGRLPTEAEWEYAARGPDAPVYPWGNRFDGTRLNYCDRNCPFDWADTSVDDGYQFTAPVGTYPDGASWVGAEDMAGNVWEWVNDWYASDYYANSPAENPAGPSDTGRKALRGGAWFEYNRRVRAADRGYVDVPAYANVTVGFRCAQE